MKEDILGVRDYDGVEVILEKSVWHGKILHPALGHPEVKDYLNEIKLTVQSPEAVYASARDYRSRLFYRSGLTRGKFKNYWIVVVVKYPREPSGLKGYVSTAFIARSLKKRGEKLWPRLAN